jgi:hypothetical protein
MRGLSFNFKGREMVADPGPEIMNRNWIKGKYHSKTTYKEDGWNHS